MNEIIETLVPYVIAGVVVLIVGAIALRIFIPRMIVSAAKRKLPADERDTFNYKQRLLEHEEIVELYAPLKKFQKEIERNAEKPEKPRQQIAWLSPYPRAVNEANGRNRPAKNARRVLMARSQVAEAAKAISVAELPPELQPGNAGPEHFYITLQLRGKAEGKVRSLEGSIKSQLGLHSLEPADSENYFSVRYVGHEVAPEDRLIQMKEGADWLDDHKPARLNSIPLAVKPDGTPWALPVHHTMILGMTGSGKGSPIHGLIRQLVPGVNDGRVHLYGADPKASELPPYGYSTLFKDLAYTNDDMQALIKKVHGLMKLRSLTKKIDLENGDLGRSLAYTTETPLILFIIDEFLSLLTSLQGKKGGAEYIDLLTEILAQGRSLGVIVVAATQEADKELFGRMRGNFANAIVLKQPSDYFNDLFLGKGAAEAGFDSTKIPAANPANNYASAGIGYVKGETGTPARVRFAYSSDPDIIALVQANRSTEMPDLWPKLAAEVAKLRESLDESSTPKDDDDGEFTMTELPELTDDMDCFSGPVKDGDLIITDGALPDISDEPLSEL